MPMALVRVRRALPVLLLVLLLSGCCESVPPGSVEEALFRVNDNLARLDQPLSCATWVSFKYRDPDGKRHRFPAHDARLTYNQPRYLLFDVKSLAGVIAEFGSNDEYYWLWIEPEARKLWIGHWTYADDPATRRLAVPPDELLDALMLRPLPLEAEGGAQPELRLRAFDHRLIYHHVDPSGRPRGTREVNLDRCAPYQPREIIDRLADGEVVMHARLKNYRRVGGDGPWTARHYVVEWPRDDAELRVDVLTAEFRPDLAELVEDIFMAPLAWDGEIEWLDRGARSGDVPQEGQSRVP